MRLCSFKKIVLLSSSLTDEFLPDPNSVPQIGGGDHQTVDEGHQGRLVVADPRLFQFLYDKGHAVLLLFQGLDEWKLYSFFPKISGFECYFIVFQSFQSPNTTLFVVSAESCKQLKHLLAYSNGRRPN